MRTTASKWVGRYRRFGELGLIDRASTPKRQPTATSAEVVERIESMRRDHKWSASRITFELERGCTTISRRTVTRLLAQLNLNRRGFIDSTGENNRDPRCIIAERPGRMVHIDGKKVGRIPDGGGWRVHGKGSEQARAVERAKKRGTRIGYVFLHSAIDGYSRLAYTEALHDESILAEEFLYARTWTSDDQRRDALQAWNRHYDYHRPHGAHDGGPPASQTPRRVHNVLASYS